MMDGRYSPEIITRRERGRIRIDATYMKVFCETLNIGSTEREALMGFARTECLKQKGDPATVETECMLFRQNAKIADIYTASLIPAGLQTFGYARALSRSYGCRDAEELAKNKLTWAQQRMTDTTLKTRLVFLESALYTPIDSSLIICEQLKKLRMFQDTDTFQFRVISWDTFVAVPLHELFAILNGVRCLCETRLGLIPSEDKPVVETLQNDFDKLFSIGTFGDARNKIIQRAIDYQMGKQVIIDKVYADFLPTNSISSAEQMTSWRDTSTAS